MDSATFKAMLASGELDYDQKSGKYKLKELPIAISKPDNVRVKNARKVELNGIKFDSELEKYFYRLLKEAGVEFEFQYRIELIPKYELNDEKVRAMAWKADFFVPKIGFLIDTKGFPTEIFKLKYKLFGYLRSQGKFPEIKEVHLPKNKHEAQIISMLIKRLLK